MHDNRFLFTRAIYTVEVVRYEPTTQLHSAPGETYKSSRRIPVLRTTEVHCWLQLFFPLRLVVALNVNFFRTE
jgi:hypothetical protein